VKKVINGGTRGLVITVSGPHGTGKSTYAKALANALKLRYASAGEIFRDLAKENKMTLAIFSQLAEQDPAVDKMIDERTRMIAKEGGVVIDAQLAAWMVGDLADLKLLLVAPDEIRFKRIAQRERVSFSTAREETLAREEIQKRRYKRYYGIDVTDLRIYDLKIDTSMHSIGRTKAFIIENAKDFLAKKRTETIKT